MSMHRTSAVGKIGGIVVLICLVLIFGILGYAYISDTNTSVLGKDEILSNIESGTEDNENYTYLSSYIKKLGVGNISTYKINEAETKINDNFYKQLPAKQELAKTIVSLFISDFYDKIDLNDKTAVTDAILTCYIKALGDPYAYYRTAKEFNDYSNNLESGDEFVGIGVLMNSETLEITMVYKDSGAYEAGIRPKDIIYGVDGKTTDDTPKEELLEMLKGEAGSTVKVKVKRAGEVLEFNVVRKLLKERTVIYEMVDDYTGYIYISQFLGTTSAEFIEAVDYCTQMNATSLVIDVRYNPGGLISSVVEVIDYLTPDADNRRIGSYSQAGTEYVYYTTDGHGVNIPIVVICNEYSASAAELFTGAMRDYGNEGVLNTCIIGTTTYGKGIAQTSFYLHDGSAITFTIGYFNPPSNVNFHGVGVRPDVEVQEVEGTDAPYNAALLKADEMARQATGAAIYYGYAA